MSSRSKKRSSVQRESRSEEVASSSQTPTSSQTRSPGRRPPSPTMISRTQEKFALQNLNDRLATYIDRVRQLEAENRSLTTQIRTQEETVTREVTNIKSLYEQELADARKLLDETAKERAKLQIDVNKLRSENEDYKEKFTTAENGRKAAEKRLLAADAQVNDLQARLNDAINQRKHFETEYNKAKAERDTFDRQLATARKQLEEETIARVDLENRVQSLKEELAFKSSVHEQELNETRTRVTTEIQEVDSRLEKEYESRLRDALSDARDENDAQIKLTRDETEAVFQTKLAQLRELAERNDQTAQSARDEIRGALKRVDELTQEVTRLTAQNAANEGRIRELENALSRERNDHTADVTQRDNEIQRLRDSLEDQIQEYRDLLDIKLSLDAEIAMYRKLLEAEESRLNLSAETTPSRTTPGSASRKRKRYDEESSSSFYSKATSGYAVTASNKGDVEILETSEDGKFVKLHNTSSEKEVSLGGWQLKHTAGAQETVYKFHRSTLLKPDASVTVWSADSGTTHSPPADLVIKQRWFTADIMTTVLMNSQGQEEATREMKRQQLRTLRYGAQGREGDPQQRCVVM